MRLSEFSQILSGALRSKQQQERDVEGSECVELERCLCATALEPYTPNS
jgi:hypothetical protein